MGRVEVALERGDVGYERVVALKWLLPEAARDRRQTEMFLREARLATLLDHPNVVHAFDAGEIDGEFFLAMEYVAGEPLSHVLKRVREREGGVPPPLAAHILAEICEGLHAAHELRGPDGRPLHVVHRDVSPHNVMIGFDGQVKLLDFGVAKIGSENGLTKTGEVKGKVAYMSPEQAMGDALDRTSDLYSVGAVLYECVAGKKMWEGTDMEVLRHLALGEPPSLEDAAPGAPVELCDLYAQLVTRTPSDRPGTARHVAERLRAFAAKSGGASSDAAALKALMARLFDAEAAARRRALSTSLAGAAPREADGLRRSVHARTSSVVTPLGASEPGDAPWTQRDDPRAGDAAHRAIAPSRARRALSIVASFAVAVSVTTGALWLQRGRGAPGRPESIANADTQPPEGPRVATSGPASAAPALASAASDPAAAIGGAKSGDGAPPDGTASAPGEGRASARTPGTSSATSGARPSAGSPSPRPRPGGAAPGSKPRPPSKPVDVDPNPI